jgi:autotransporter-associated beta strand protein
MYNGSTGSGWNSASNWVPSGVPGGGSVADLFKLNTSCIFNLPAGTDPDLSAVQIANGGTLSFTSVFSSNSTLDTTALEVGGMNTGLGGRGSSTGGGNVSQGAGLVYIDGGGVLAVDSASAYTLSGSSPTLTLLTGAGEVLAGTFTQSAGTNQIYNGGYLQNTGTYLLQNTSSPILSCNSYINSGSFNQTGGTVQAYPNSSAGSFSFNNSGTYYYSLGSFLGVMTNNGNVQVNGAAIPFASGIVNNGLFTINASTGSFAGTISGNSPSASIVIKEGSSSVTLSGNNNYSGATIVSTGTLILNSSAGTVLNNYGSALQGNVTISANGTLQLNASDQIASNVQLTINGGTFNLNSFNESVGSLVMDAGTVQQSGGLGLGVTTGLITIGTGSAIINGGIRSPSGTPLTFNISTGNTATVYGAMANYNSAAGQSLVLNGGGTLYFSAASSLSTITINNGILQLA